MPDILQTNSKVLSGQLVIRDTRIPVSRVMALLGMGYSLKDLKDELPQLSKLTKKDLSDILSYFREQLNYRQAKTSKN